MEEEERKRRRDEMKEAEAEEEEAPGEIGRGGRREAGLGVQ